jgi:hypothetical protein
LRTAAALLLLLLAAGCRTAAVPSASHAAAGWPRHILSAGHDLAPGYSVAVPPDLVRNEVRGIDSEVAQFEGGGLRLDFDYGWYGGFMSCERRPSCREWEETIDGRTWRISSAAPDISAGGPYRRLLSARVQVDERVKLAVGAACADEAACERALAVVRSVRIGR